MKLIEGYPCSAHQENYYFGTKTGGKLEITVAKIENRLAQEKEHRVSHRPGHLLSE